MTPILPNPTFFSVTGFTQVPGRLIQTPMNPDYFADDATAMTLAKYFGARYVEQRLQAVPPMIVRMNQPDGTPNPAGDVAYENWLLFPAGSRLKNADGSLLITAIPFDENAGLLAAFFSRNPEVTFGNQIFGSLAAKFVWDALRAKYQFGI